MNLPQVLAMAGALGMDAMSVSAAVGVRWHGPRQKFRLAWHMGLFQCLMPILGWLAGSRLAGLLEAWGTYLAAALVFGVGAKMLVEAVRSRPGAAAESAAEPRHRDPTRGWSLVVLSVATSLDALVVGVSLGLDAAPGIGWSAVVIGIVAGGMSLAGIAIGKRFGTTFGRSAEIAGAVVLMVLAASFLVW